MVLLVSAALFLLSGTAWAEKGKSFKFQGPADLDVAYELGIRPGLTEHASPSMPLPDTVLSHGFRVKYTYRILPWLLLGGAIGYAEYSVDENLYLTEDGKASGVEHRMLFFPIEATLGFDLLPSNERLALLATVDIGYLAIDYQAYWKDAVMQDSASTMVLGGGIEFKAWLWKSLSSSLGIRYDFVAIDTTFSGASGWRYKDPGDPSALVLFFGLGWSL